MKRKSGNGKTKTIKTLTLNASVLGKIREVEQSMAAREAADLEGSLPEGHPLKAALEEQKAALGGDLRDMPENHPLIVSLKAAREAYEARQQKQAMQPSDEEKTKLKRAKRLKEVEVRRQARAKEDREASELRVAASDVNTKMDEVMQSLKEVWQAISGNEHILCRNGMNRAKIMRLKRLVMAVERGFSGIRMNRGV